MRRIVFVTAVLAAVAVVATACVPPYPGTTRLYLDPQADIVPSVTPKATAITWGAAPAIDANYGGTLYVGTGLQTQDPRPALLTGGLEPLRLWVADPNNGVANRPAIIWLHGGGFAVGIDSMYGLANTTGKEYAQRGYVSISVEYRTDTTLVGTGARPPSLCQWVQDNENPTDPVWVQRRDQCARNVLAAQYDAQGALRYIRAHATEFGIDPNKIAVGGFSAGAVTAVNMAYRSDDIGTVSYFSGDPMTSAASTVKAAFGASGCLYSLDGQLNDIGAGDGPVSLIESRFDGAVPYSCVANTVATARSRGLVAELTSYCTESLHAAELRDAHKVATDEQWTDFLARYLPLYSNVPPMPDQPLCTN
jgi:predicted esterase